MARLDDFENKIKDNLQYKFTTLSDTAYGGKARLMINSVHWFALARLFGYTEELSKIVNTHKSKWHDVPGIENLYSQLFF